MTKYDSLFFGSSAAPASCVKFVSVAVNENNNSTYTAGSDIALVSYVD